jgi:hypothetical protein
MHQPFKGIRKDWEEGDQYSGLHDFSRNETKRCAKSLGL